MSRVKFANRLTAGYLLSRSEGDCNSLKTAWKSELKLVQEVKSDIGRDIQKAILVIFCNRRTVKTSILALLF